MPSAVPSAAAAARLLRTHLVFGANTDVGKTVVTAGLLRAHLLKAASGAGSADKTAPAASSPTTHYIKPLQCGGATRVGCDVMLRFPRAVQTEHRSHLLHIRRELFFVGRWEHLHILRKGTRER